MTRFLAPLDISLCLSGDVSPLADYISFKRRLIFIIFPFSRTLIGEILEKKNNARRRSFLRNFRIMKTFPQSAAMATPKKGELVLKEQLLKFKNYSSIYWFLIRKGRIKTSDRRKLISTYPYKPKLMNAKDFQSYEHVYIPCFY